MASMLKSVDESLGRLLDALDELQLAENTVVIFASDNGGNTSTKKAQTVDDYHQWVGDLPPTSNAPLRDGKGSLYEGGCRVPLIVRWPGKVAAAATSEAVVHAYDFYPTLLDLLGLEKNAAQTFDGISFAKTLSDPAAKLAERPIFIAAQNGCALRLGDWKLVRYYTANAYELYDLKADLGETTDLAAKLPDKVKELEALLMAHFQSATGIPRPFSRIK
jgi:arylsulfatase A-like enzyme